MASGLTLSSLDTDYSLGVILNWGTHILDITLWALNTERTGPVEVEGTGEFPKNNLWNVLQAFEFTTTTPAASR